MAQDTSSRAETSGDGSGALLARTTNLPARLGKATEELKCKVPDVVKADFQRLAAELDLTTSDLLRDLVMHRLYGPDMFIRLAEQRARLVAGIGPEREPQA